VFVKHLFLVFNTHIFGWPIPFSALTLRLAPRKRLCDDAEMRPRIQAVVIPSESSEFADELSRLLKEIGRSAGSLLTAECSPPLDIYETDDAFEIAMDLPGVDLSAVRVVAKGNAVLIAGEKIPRRGRGDSSFHLVERGYGRFARVARLTKPCDSSQARATLVDGELRISLPKIADRRGRPTTIQVAGARPIA
jgi:HSP20 family protein